METATATLAQDVDDSRAATHGAAGSDDATTPTDESTTEPRERGEALVERLFAGLVDAMELFTIHVGLETGLYRHLADLPGATAGVLADHADLDERYVTEWLAQQAAAGLVDIASAPGAPSDMVDQDPATRRHVLPPAHAEVLLAETSPSYLGPAGMFAVGLGQAANQVAAAFRTGGGVAYEDYGPELRRGIAAFNRPMLESDLADTWMPSVPEVHEFLASHPAPRILDVGCGLGRSTIELARAYPRATVHGIDLDAASVQEARVAASQAGVANRVVFTEADAIDLDGDDRYHLVTSFEMLHDSADPVGVLRTARRLLQPGGHVLIADDAGAESFTSPADDYERFLYAFSVLQCLPSTRAEDGPHAHGTVVRPADALGWIEAAGFSSGRVLDIDNDLWRFYLATP